MVGRVYMPPDTYWQRRSRQRGRVPLALKVVLLVVVVLLIVGVSLAVLLAWQAGLL